MQTANEVVAINNPVAARLFEEPMESVAAEPSVANASILLAECIELNDKLKAAKKVVDDIDEKLSLVKERVKDLFIEMGVKSMKSGKQNVYLSKQIWAGIAVETPKDELANALVSADMQDYITCNSQKLSSYVREIALEHPEFYNSDGDMIASTEEIVAVLPEPFNNMIKVSEKIDIRIRK
jgi:hypothetical protein